MSTLKKLRSEMASHEETPSLSLRNGFRCVPEDGVSVEDVLVSTGEEVGHENIVSASRMNKAVVVFLKDHSLVNRVIETGLVINENLVQVTPLYAPSAKITVSNVPPFIPDDALERELARFGKFASGFKTIPLGCKHPSLKHVKSFRRQVFMFLDSPENSMDVSFRVRHDGRTYMVYASTGHLRCYECGDFGHKKFTCPHREQAVESGPGVSGEGSVSEISVQAEGSTPCMPVSNDDAAPSATKTVEKVAIISDGRDIDVNVSQKVKCIRNDVQNIRGDEQPENNVMQAGPSSSSCVEDGCMQASQKALCSSNDASVIDDVSDDNGSIDFDCDSQAGSVCGPEGTSQDMNKDSSFYTLEEINIFLDDSFGRQVNIKDFFPDVEKFERSVAFLYKNVSHDLLSEKKRFRLKKHITSIRKCRKVDKKRKLGVFL